MEHELLGRPPEGPVLDLDYREFAYAGKFVMSGTGKAVTEENGEIVGAVAFSSDRDDASSCHLRYVTVRDSRQGEGIGTRLLRYTAETLRGDPYERVLIAVNNPVAYRAGYRAGFYFTGRESGIAELVLEYDPDGERSEDTYREGLRVFGRRDLPEPQLTPLERRSVPAVVDP